MAADLVPHVLAEGSKPLSWKSKEDPRTDFLTRIAAAAFTAGFDLISSKGYQHHVIVDESPAADPAAPVDRSVTWIWDGRQTVTFSPAFAEETIGLAEFRARFESLEWVAANPHHPIAYMRAFLEKSRDTMGKVTTMPPALRITRGDRTVVAPPGATEEEIEAQFEDLDEICR